MARLNNYSNLQECLRALTNMPTHDFGTDDIRIVSLSAALLGESDKRRLKLLEAAGDNAFSMAVATRCLTNRLTAQDYQDARSVVTSNRVLAGLLVKRGLDRYVTYSASVSPQSKAGANSMEAFAGLVYYELGMPGVLALCQSIQFFDEYDRW